LLPNTALTPYFSLPSLLTRFSKLLINLLSDPRYGFPSQGVAAVRSHLSAYWRGVGTKDSGVERGIVGVNVGKNKDGVAGE
jgi:hypothetical protein